MWKNREEHAPPEDKINYDAASDIHCLNPVDQNADDRALAPYRRHFTSDGALNGYLIIGSLWSFLEYRIQAPGQWLQLPAGEPYPFDFSVLVRPDVAGELGTLMGRLPLPVLEPYLPFLVVIVFLFVIIVMI